MPKSEHEDIRDQEALLPSEDPHHGGLLPAGRMALWWTWIGQAVLLSISIVILAFARNQTPSDAQCVRVLSPYSPALEAVEYHEQTLDGRFTAPSPYRGTPTPEIDARWEELWDWGAFSVPEDKLHLLNKSAAQPWHHVDQGKGGGVAGLFWGFHQIHCLDILRQVSFKDVYVQSGQKLPSILSGDEETNRMHIDHCIELLRIDMMCQADITPYLVLDALPGDAPEDLRIDFSMHKKCRNYDKIKNWMSKNIAVSSVRETAGHSGL